MGEEERGNMECRVHELGVNNTYKVDEKLKEIMSTKNDSNMS